MNNIAKIQLYCANTYKEFGINDYYDEREAVTYKGKIIYNYWRNVFDFESSKQENYYVVENIDEFINDFYYLLKITQNPYYISCCKRYFECLLLKSTLSEKDLLKCQRVIYDLTKNQNLYYSDTLSETDDNHTNRELEATVINCCSVDEFDNCIKKIPVYNTMASYKTDDLTVDTSSVCSILKTVDNNEIQKQVAQPSIPEKNEKEPLSKYLLDHSTIMTDINYSSNPAVGRDEEIKKAMVSLFEKSIVLVGEPGVGKTAIVEGIAYNVQNGNVPSYLKNKKILQFHISTLISGCSLVGMLEQRMKNIFDELSKRDDVIVFIDEIHSMVGGGAGKNGMDIANIIKPYIDRNQVTIIGATTKDEYETKIKLDPAFKRRLEPIIVKEPNKDILFEITTNVIKELEKNTQISFENYENIVNALIDSTSKEHRKYDDMVYNPDLILSIIRKIFSYAAYYNRKAIEINDVEEAVNSCERLYSYAKERLLLRLNEFKQKVDKSTIECKIIKFPKR